MSIPMIALLFGAGVVGFIIGIVFASKRFNFQVISRGRIGGEWNNVFISPDNHIPNLGVEIRVEVEDDSGIDHWRIRTDHEGATALTTILNDSVEDDAQS